MKIVLMLTNNVILFIPNYNLRGMIAMKIIF